MIALAHGIVPCSLEPALLAALPVLFGGAVLLVKRAVRKIRGSLARG